MLVPWNLRSPAIWAAASRIFSVDASPSARFRMVWLMCRGSLTPPGVQLTVADTPIVWIVPSPGDTVIRNLSSVGFASPADGAGRSFGPEVLGAELAPGGADGAVRLRFDEAPWRVAVHPAGTNGLRYLGWDAGDSIEAAI